ncbi:sugar transferase [Streptomyces longwoodensis]|uniref:sugar transferase n=1 Tax=Streptomyces longwoodensis TaxID=68231 RepID=UPI002E81CA00|nr:sugar transferase [Streptomyces longwoodensis]WUC55674.1 sugar transferase [Streptomyces longwoodensis]WUC62207.1 sugar transferase [Streptomyces longwoodensis]
MKNWMRNSGGGVVGSAEHSEAELTDEEADRVNAYEARLHEVTSSLATEAEVDELLLQAKIEVARRNAIASHQGVPAGSPPCETAARRRTPLRTAAEMGVSLLGDLISLWIVFMVMYFAVAPHLNAINDIAQVLIFAGAGVTAGAVSSNFRRTFKRRQDRAETIHPEFEPWWHERMENLAEDVEFVKLPSVMRVIDIIFSVVSMAIMSVPLVIGFLLIKSKGREVLERQPRVGQGGRVFTRYKFNVHVSESGTPATHSDLFLIRSGIEQLPRLWNLLNGDLTLVGPKPENPALAIRYPQSCRWVFAYRPGLTGPVSPELRTWLTVQKFDAGTYLTQIVPLQSAYDRYYFALPTMRQLCIMTRALLLLMVPLIIENMMLSERSRTSHGVKSERAQSHPVPEMPATDCVPTGEQVSHVTKWSRHEYDQAFA